jgi:hypothetical protein
MEESHDLLIKNKTGIVNDSAEKSAIWHPKSITITSASRLEK